MSSITDKLTATYNTQNPEVATVSSARSIGGTSLSATSLNGWPDGTVHFITYKKTAAGLIDKTTQCDWKAIKSSTTLGTLTLKNGTDAGNDVGDFIEMAPTAPWGQDLYDGLTQTLNVDGTLKSSIVASSNIVDGTIATADIADAAVTPAKWTNSYKFSVYRSSAWTSSNSGSGSVVQYDTKKFDTGSNVDIVTNKGRFTAPVAGFYWFVGTAGNTTAGGGGAANLHVNGSIAAWGTDSLGDTAVGKPAQVTALLQLSANDYVEVYYFGGGGSTGLTGSTFVYFQGFLVSET